MSNFFPPSSKGSLIYFYTTYGSAYHIYVNIFKIALDIYNSYCRVIRIVSVSVFPLRNFFYVFENKNTLSLGPVYWFHDPKLF